MNKLKALIFDVDGTLAETEEAHLEAFNRVFAEAGLGWNWSADQYRVLLKTTGGQERIAEWQTWPEAGGKSLTPEEITKLHKRKTELYHVVVKEGGLELRPGVRTLIDVAKNAGLRVGVATTTSRINVDALCQSCWGKPASEVFEAVAAGDEVKAKKPAPDLYELALERLGLLAENCLAFEDNRNGFLSAEGAGLRVVATPSSFTMEEDFRGASWVVEDLRYSNLPTVLRNALGLDMAASV